MLLADSTVTRAPFIARAADHLDALRGKRLAEGSSPALERHIFIARSHLRRLLDAQDADRADRQGVAA